ncbi:glycosyltransferase family 2 protein [Nitrospira sp. Nam74]
MALPDCTVTVVVLTHNRAEEVLRTLKRLLSLPERPAIIVVDNGSTDGTADILASRLPGIRIIALERNIGAAGRNVGIREAKTLYVALCDDDTWWAPGSLGLATEALESYPHVAVVTGRVLVGRHRREDRTCQVMAASPLTADSPLPGPPVLGFLAGACMIRRPAFLDVGGFEPRFFLGGEEALVAVDLASAGWYTVYMPEVLIHHYPSSKRDAPARRRLLLRNALWFTWLRRPLAKALRHTGRVLYSSLQHPQDAVALLHALAGLPWILRHRRCLPHAVEAALLTLDQSSS